MEEDSTTKLDRSAASLLKESRRSRRWLDKRIQTDNYGPLTDAEVTTIQSNVSPRLRTQSEAISDWDFFRNQDDNIGFTMPSSNIGHGYGHESEIKFRFRLPKSRGSARTLTLTQASREAVRLPLSSGKAQRDALKAKNDEISSLQTRKTLLQDQLHHATPQQKSAIIAQITETSELIGQAEGQIPGLQAALESCLPNTEGVDIDRTIEVHSG